MIALTCGVCYNFHIRLGQAKRQNHDNKGIRIHASSAAANLQRFPATLTTAQVPSALTDFFSWCHDPFTHASKARPLRDVGWTFLSVSLSLSLLAAIDTTICHCAKRHLANDALARGHLSIQMLASCARCKSRQHKRLVMGSSPSAFSASSTSSSPATSLGTATLPFASPAHLNLWRRKL